MNSIEDESVARLRPEVRPLDPEWSAATLQAILAEPAVPSVRTRGSGRRWRLRLAAGVAAGAVAAAVVGLVGPAGSPGTSPAAAALAGELLATHPEVGPGEYLHIKKVERTWGYGGAGTEAPSVLEYWIPGDRTSRWVERSGTAGDVEDHAFSDWGPKLYVEHSADPAILLEELRAYAKSQDEGADLHGLFTVAFWIVTDPVAPQSFKDEVMTAFQRAGGAQVVDPSFSAGGLQGAVLTIPEEPRLGFVIDPETSAFRGFVGHPEKDDTWVGPEAPMWTITFDYVATSDAPSA